MRSLDAGLKPGFVVDTDNRATAEILDEVLGQWVTRAYGKNPCPVAVRLLSEGHGTAEIRAVLWQFLQAGVTPEDLRSLNPGAEAIRRKIQGLLESVQSFHGLIDPILRANNGKYEKALSAMDELATLKERLEVADDAFDLQSACDLAIQGNLEKKLKAWHKKLLVGEAKVLSDIEPTIKQQSIPLLKTLEHLANLDLVGLSQSGEMLADILDEVLKKRTHLGVVSFQELLLKMRDLLRNDPQVLKDLRASLDQLLVDEVQDTDPSQYDIVTSIALMGPEHERPGLFVVGDPKQSIYGFRGADLAAYEDFIEHIIKNCDGQKHVLHVNFRSVPAILEEVENTVAPVMLADPGVQPPFERLIPSEANLANNGWTDDDRRPVEHWVSWSLDPASQSQLAKTKAGHAREIEAKALADEIAQLKTNDPEFQLSEVGVLLRATTEQETYLAALRARDIPYLVDGDRSYYRRVEIVDAVSALSCILDPHDQLSLVGFLRSSMVGIPDAALIPLWRRSFPDLFMKLGQDSAEAIAAVTHSVHTELSAEFPDHLGVPNWHHQLIRAAEVIAHLRVSYREESTDRFVAMMRDLLGQEEIEAGRYLGAHRLANLDRFYRLLATSLSRGGGVARILHDLRGHIREAHDEKEASNSNADIDAVRVMTIHRAKGLTFDQVFLPSLGQGGRHATRSEDTLVPMGRSFQMRIFGRPSLDLDRALISRQAVDAAERIRTFYVAVTRPRKRLVFLGNFPDPTKEPLPVAQMQRLVDILPWRRGQFPRLPDKVPEVLHDQATVLLKTDTLRVLMSDCCNTADGGQVSALELDKPQVVPAMYTATQLSNWRSEATQVMEHQTHRRPSQAHEYLDTSVKFADSQDKDEGAPIPSENGNDDIARFVGTAVHEAIESWSHDGTAKENLEQAMDSARQRIAMTLIDESLAKRVSEATQKLLAVFSEGPCLSKLADLHENKKILAKELPIILSESHDGQEHVSTGSIDMLYRDPETDNLVVVDFKTDARLAPWDHGAQGMTYAVAVQKALGLLQRPIFELWYLKLGRILREAETAQ